MFQLISDKIIIDNNSTTRVVIEYSLINKT